MPSSPPIDRKRLAAALLLTLTLCACSPDPDAVEIRALPAEGPAGQRLADLAEEAGYRLGAEWGYPRPTPRHGGISVELSWARFSPVNYAARLQAVVRDGAGRQVGRTLLIEPVPERLFSPLSTGDELGALAGRLVQRLQRDLLAPAPNREPAVADLQAAACRDVPPPVPVAETPVAVLRIDGEQGCGSACRSALLQHGYAAVEAELLDPPEAAGGLPPYGLADRPGLWRFTAAPAGDPACAAFDRLAREDATSLCIAAAPADSLTARFAYAVRARLRVYGWGSDAVRLETVRDAASGAVLAERERHVFQRNDLPRPSGIVRCPGLDTPPLYVTVLPPARGQD